MRYLRNMLDWRHALACGLFGIATALPVAAAGINDGPAGIEQPGSRTATFDRWAVVNSTGTLARGKGVTSALRLGTGQYQVILDETITHCVFIASLGPATPVGVPSGQASVAVRAGTVNGVFVETTDSAGATADRGFHLFVGCA